MPRGPAESRGLQSSGGSPDAILPEVHGAAGGIDPRRGDQTDTRNPETLRLSAGSRSSLILFSAKSMHALETC